MAPSCGDVKTVGCTLAFLAITVLAICLGFLVAGDVALQEGNPTPNLMGPEVSLADQQVLAITGIVAIATGAGGILMYAGATVVVGPQACDAGIIVLAFLLLVILFPLAFSQNFNNVEVIDLGQEEGAYDYTTSVWELLLDTNKDAAISDYATQYFAGGAEFLPEVNGEFNPELADQFKTVMAAEAGSEASSATFTIEEGQTFSLNNVDIGEVNTDALGDTGVEGEWKVENTGEDGFKLFKIAEADGTEIADPIECFTDLDADADEPEPSIAKMTEIVEEGKEAAKAAGLESDAAAARAAEQAIEKPADEAATLTESEKSLTQQLAETNEKLDKLIAANAERRRLPELSTQQPNTLSPGYLLPFPLLMLLWVFYIFQKRYKRYARPKLQFLQQVVVYTSCGNVLSATLVRPTIP